MAGRTRVIMDPQGFIELETSPAMLAALEVEGLQVQADAKLNAPRSPDGNHGRNSGYLASQIHLSHGYDVLGVHVDVSTDAEAPDGFPYGVHVEFIEPYLRPAVEHGGF